MFEKINMISVKTINDIEIEDVHDLFDSVIFLRGEEYFEEGLVTLIEPINSCTITGTVRGNQTYNVSISIDADGDILCDCSCPCDFNCKHAAALLLKWLSIKKNYRKKLKQVKPHVKETLGQILAKKSKTELIELVETIVENNPELKSYVTIERKEIVTRVKKLFSNFWEWHEVRNLISQLETILEGIQNNKNQWNKDLFNEMKVCSSIMMDNVENVYDEGELSMFLGDWFQTYGEIFAQIRPTVKQKKEFIQTIVDWIDKDDYGLDGSYEQALFGMCTTIEDIVLIDSPVGLPARVVKNKFVEDILKGIKKPVNCPWKCLKTCDYKEVSFCIAQALFNAAQGKMEEGFAFAGTNAYLTEKIISIKEVFEQLKDEYYQEQQLENIVIM